MAIKPGPPICHQTSREKMMEQRRNVIIKYCAKIIAEVQMPLRTQYTSQRPRKKSGLRPCMIPASTAQSSSDHPIEISTVFPTTFRVTACNRIPEYKAHDGMSRNRYAIAYQ